MDRYAVIGQPIAHSLSPRIHPAFGAQLGTPVTYEAIEISPDRLEYMLQRLHAERYLGLNVTLPHKASVANLCVSHSARAELAGAVNTLVRVAGGWHGDNTDGEGLIRDLERLGITVAAQRVLVLGAGGAARGIIGPLLELQPTELVISNRTPWKPEELAAYFTKCGPIRPTTHLALKGDHFDLIINATSAGHGGAIPRLPSHLLNPQGCAYDLSYGSAAAPFLAWAGQQHARLVSDGLGMLVEQAASAFALWRGTRPHTHAVLNQLRGH